jgi:hypothetical protein
MTIRQENRGGRRDGSGRKPKKKPNYDLKFKRAILRAARKLVRKHGKPIEEAVLELVYLPETQDAVKVAIWKTYLEMFMVKKSEKDVIVKDETIGPRIGLPPMREDSALKIVEGGTVKPK